MRGAGARWGWATAFVAALLGVHFYVEGRTFEADWIEPALYSLAFLFLIPMIIASLRHQRETTGKPSSAQKRYIKRMAVVSILYLGAVFAAAGLIDEGDPITPVSVVIAAVPALGILGYFWALGRLLVEEQDEFMRMLFVRQMLTGAGIALSLAAVWGFLESFGQVPHVDAYWWPIAWFFGLGIGALVNKLTYGTTGENCA